VSPAIAAAPARADEAPAVRIVIGGNIPLEGMRAATPAALPAPTDLDLDATADS
jgi:hypothetical protein